MNPKGEMVARNILLKLEYRGDAFEGWQTQARGRTVQGVLKENLEKFLRHEVKITGAGRTDAGVHAFAQYANFRTDSQIAPDDIRHKLNRMLPEDVAVLSCREVRATFDSRRAAARRSYRYLICERVSAINRGRSWVIARQLDLDKLERLASMVEKARHFDNFCKTKSLKESNECLIYEARWVRGEGFLRFDITANRFLHNMVRLLVGTMLAVHDSKMDEKHFAKILNNEINEKTKYIAPACGLYLAAVGYERGSL